MKLQELLAKNKQKATLLKDIIKSFAHKVLADDFVAKLVQCWNVSFIASESLMDFKWSAV